jgi:hypothetical protein
MAAKVLSVHGKRDRSRTPKFFTAIAGTTHLWNTFINSISVQGSQKGFGQLGAVRFC